MTEAPSNSKRTAAIVVVAVVFFVAFGLRLLGIGWGLPDAQRAFSLHPDEPINLLYSRQVEPTRLSFAPDFYNYGTLYLTATHIASDVATTYGGKNPRAELLGPRVLSSLAGSILAALVALFFARRNQWAAAWTGGLAAATANGLVIHSRFATVDVMATALLTAGLIVAMGAQESAKPRRALVGAAVLVGLATACKYNMALGLLGVLVAAWGGTRERRALDLALPVVAFLATFVLGVPGALTQPASFRRDVQYELLHTATGHGLVFEATAPGFLFHLSNLLLACGVFTLFLGTFGLGLAARSMMRWSWIAIAFAVPYFLLIGRAEVKFFRYVLPLVPVLAMGFGALIQELVDRGKERVGIATAILSVAGFFPGGLSAAVVSTVEMAGPDPRDAAGAYLRDVAKNGSVGLTNDPWFWSPTIYPEVPAPRSVGPSRYLGWMVRQTNPRVLRYLPPNARERLDFDPRLLTESRPDYVAITSLERAAAQRFADTSASLSPEAEATKTRYVEFMRLLNEGYVPAERFGDDHAPNVEDLEYVWPTVYVWKRKKD